MTKNEAKAQELIQQVYFDICDLLNGGTYQDIGYCARKDFLEEQRERMAEIEERLFSNQGEK